MAVVNDDIKLQVKNLVLSFKTVSGKVQAVRNISFDLKKGETLAIVGESGSGKSVTARAIMGILARNAIVEGGEIFYDGKDLLRIKEDDMHKIRGNKISMVFQDPMSSLNPIVKIGRQLTEAMVLKGRSKQRECKAEFNQKLRLVHEHIDDLDDQAKAEYFAKLDRFAQIEDLHSKLEKKYNLAHQNALDCITEITDALFEIKESAFTDAKMRLKNIIAEAKSVFNEFVVIETPEYLEHIELLKQCYAHAAKLKAYEEVVKHLEAIKETLDQAVAKTKPDFFALAYHILFVEPTYDSTDIDKLNATNEEVLNKEFLDDFYKELRHSVVGTYAYYKGLVNQFRAKLGDYKKVFEVEKLDKKLSKQALKEVSKEQENTINHLELEKDSIQYTFSSALKAQINRYFYGIKHNQKELDRFDKETKKVNKIIAKGKVPSWAPNPASIVDLELTRQNILLLFDELEARYAELDNTTYNYDEIVKNLVAYLIASAAGKVNRVTKNMAKNEAIKMMKEVGIPEPRRRYYQYPFEFSGGMRQRIVIAIALVANPDVLICDEPTTALDVTIQANILELIEKLKKERNLSIIFITHDLGVVANVADKVAVMYAGKIVESGTADDIFYDPKHPYTWALLSSMPDLDTNEKLEAIPGTPPNMIFPPKGDAFAARNKYAMKIDFEEQPPMFKVSDTHYAATWLLHEDAPNVEPPKIVTERIKKMKERVANNGKQ